MTNDPNWGPSGLTVYERTYSRPKPDGTRETWEDTIQRVATGNLALVYGDDWATWDSETKAEFYDLVEHMRDFRILPAGRHLWASGVKGRQYLMNCWTSGWGEKLSDHFEFAFLRLMEGGGVGANYTSTHLKPYGVPRRELQVHIVCAEDHPDYDSMLEAGVLSTEYVADWDGAFEVADSREGWGDALTDLIDTFMTDDQVKHEQRVYDVTNVRGQGSRLKTFGGTASGPEPFAVMMHKVSGVLNNAAETSPRYLITSWQGETVRAVGGHDHLSPLDAMEMDHAIAECVVSGGSRRSARMSIVRWDDPFIFDFIACKADTGEHWTTNISVEVDDEFLRLLNMPGENALEAHALDVHKAVIAGMLTNGEPGYWNSSLSNEGELQPVYATNPCGEITLQPWEACNLGHVNLDAFAPTSSAFGWDEGALVRAHELVTRFLMRATYADINDPKSRQIQDSNRRIGVGHLGVQGFINKNNWRYSDVAVNNTHPGYHAMRALLDRLYATVRNTARSYAFELRIPEPVKVTTVAPTGSVAKLPGVTEGIHPIYSRYFERRIRFALTDEDQYDTWMNAPASGLAIERDSYDDSGNTGIIVYPTKDLLVDQVEAMGYDPLIVEAASEIHFGAMLAFQAMYQKHYADNAVSFTVNVKSGLNPEMVTKSIARWLPELKGTTIMVDDSRPQSPYTRITREAYEASRWQSIEDSTDLDCATGACPIR